MADIKQLKLKIKSTKNIKKITNAMEIISTIKLQKLKKKMSSLKEFVNTFLNMVSHIELLKQDVSEVSKNLVIIVSSEKGLCGSLNSILFKKFLAENPVESPLDVYVVGKKGRDFCLRNGYNIVGYSNLGDSFTRSDLDELVSFVSSYRTNGVSSIKVRYNYFKNTMKQIPVGFQMFPIQREALSSFFDIVGDNTISTVRDDSFMKLEPTPQELFSHISQVMIDTVLYGAVLSNKTGEFAARMLAMKGAKDNANNIISDLTLAYNKARQDAITKEVLEIVSAKAVIED